MFSTFLLKQVDSVFLAYEILVYSYVIFLIKSILLLLKLLLLLLLLLLNVLEKFMMTQVQYT